MGFFSPSEIEDFAATGTKITRFKQAICASTNKIKWISTRLEQQEMGWNPKQNMGSWTKTMESNIWFCNWVSVLLTTLLIKILYLMIKLWYYSNILLYYEVRNVKDQDAMVNDKSTQDDAPKISSNRSRSVFVLLLLYKFFTSEQSSCLKRWNLSSWAS